MILSLGAAAADSSGITQLHDALKEKDESLQKMAATMSTLQDQVTLLTEENKLIKDGDNALTKLTEQLSGKQKEISDLQETVKNKDQSLQQMAQVFKEYESEMASLGDNNNKALSERDNKIKSLEDQLKMNDHELAVVSQELENMKADSEARQQSSPAGGKGSTEKLEKDVTKLKILLKKERMNAEKNNKELSELKDIASKQKAEIDELNEKHHKELVETRNVAEKNKAEADKANEMLKQREQALQQMSSQYADLYQQFSEVG